MEIRRTANAGVLLKLDGVSILMDGVCREVKPYPATPPEERALLTASWPDAVLFTHNHKDHYDPDYAAAYKARANGVIFEPGEAVAPVTVGTVEILPVPSRHIGAAGRTTKHTSFIVKGSKCVWFLGDSSPLQWKGKQDLPAPDVLMVPYAYTATETGWSITCSLGAKTVILLHMPNREDDTGGIWHAVESTIGQGSGVQIPSMGQTICI